LGLSKKKGERGESGKQNYQRPGFEDQEKVDCKKGKEKQSKTEQAAWKKGKEEDTYNVGFDIWGRWGSAPPRWGGGNTEKKRKKNQSTDLKNGERITSCWRRGGG